MHSEAVLLMALSCVVATLSLPVPSCLAIFAALLYFNKRLCPGKYSASTVSQFLAE
jgi:hypothetical protein